MIEGGCVCVRSEHLKKMQLKVDSVSGLWRKMPIYFSHCLPPSHYLVISALRLSELSAALLLAVVVKLALPVHHVGGPAVELYLPLTLCLIYVVWEKKQRHSGKSG